jgi:HNH endonuclease
MNDATRQKVLQRDGFRCSGRFLGGECSAVLDVHHILPREEGGSDALANLMTLCHAHHPMLEAIRKAILRRRAPKRCGHNHRYPWAREACERRLNARVA